MADGLHHVVAILKSVAALTPAGSAVVTAINEYVPSAHDEALMRAAEVLRDRLNGLSDRLEEEYVRTEEFADLFKNCYFVMQRTQHEEKLRGAANILTNALLREGDEDKLPYRELDHFTRCLESLSIGAIQVLGVTISRASLESRRRVNEDNIRVNFGTLHLQLSGMDHDLLMGLVAELSAMHLLRVYGLGIVQTAKYGNVPVETTPLGYRFTRYVLEPGSDKPSA